MGYIFARLIYRGARTLKSVPDFWRKATIDAYWDLYSEKLDG